MERHASGALPPRRRRRRGSGRAVPSARDPRALAQAPMSHLSRASTAPCAHPPLKPNPHKSGMGFRAVAVHDVRPTNQESPMQSVTDFPVALYNTTVREASPDDEERCGQIFYDAFASIAERHNFPVEPGSPDFTQFKAAQMLASDGFAAFVAEREGHVIASAFADDRGPIVGIGPVTVDPLA